MEEKKFIEHLDDLRSCLIRGSLGLIAGIAISFVFISPLFKILSAPYFNFLASQGIDSSSVLKSLGPADALSVTFKMALLFGFGLSSPWIAYQTWRFIGPALYKHEKKHVIIFCSSAAACFLLGVAFAYFLILPTVLSFFYRYSVSVGITPEWAITNYYSFVSAFLAGFGIVFEMPVAAVILAWLGLVTPQMLVKYRRHAIVAIFIVAAIFTPSPDAASQLMMAIPMVLLYEISILTARLVAKN
ncbi:MAG: twin-arginine translocase subunit TatC [Deltaproteobacteria bacterium]|nr:twin-arginine translocase subunit TatC [Deltaproteobacteria bacterium]MBI2341857.1 twin-arginine translocase subunit TatC [Deltaproteobacteria bacterium]